MAVTIRVRKNCLPELARQVGPAATLAQRRVLERMQATAQTRARVDTGAMKGNTVVEGDDTLHAQEPYSGFQNYGTSRGVTADYWFSGAVEAEVGQIGQQMADEIGGALKCG